MKAICSPKRCGSVLSLVLLALPLASGCGGQAKGTVSGKVTYQGKPVPSGFVTFLVENGAPVHSDIRSDGSYRMEKVPVGLVKIGVQTKAAEDALKSVGMPRKKEDFGKMKEAVSEGTQIPAKYTDPNQSGLSYTVVKGPQQHDIDLK
jgi:hypothetical protein